MFKFFILGFLVFSSSAFAAKVKVTSFNLVDNNERLAELCGQVTEAKNYPSFVNAQVDYHTNRPASYNTITDKEGKFCMTVITYRGRVQLNVMNE